MRPQFLLLIFLSLSPLAAEPQPPFPLWDTHELVETYAFPLWDNHEPIPAYAARVNLPPTRTITLAPNITLDLVLIPAGQFTMGSIEPQDPGISREFAENICMLGGSLMFAFASVFVMRILQGKKLAFSLRYLLLMTSFCGLFIGGYARIIFADQENERYYAEKMFYDKTVPANEKPAHSVTLSQPFYMGKYTVTQAQYEAVIGANPSGFRGAQLPVEKVSWNDSMEFCKKLNHMLRSQNLESRLPTEAQWEFACRAGTQTRYYSGNQESDLDAVAWHYSNCGNTTHPVGAKKPNAFGLYDMHGNVYQYCADAYMDHCETLNPIDPVNEKEDSRPLHLRVLRGGSWMRSYSDCRSSSRAMNPPWSFGDNYGFRIILTPITKIP